MANEPNFYQLKSADPVVGVDSQTWQPVYATSINDSPPFGQTDAEIAAGVTLTDATGVTNGDIIGIANDDLSVTDWFTVSSAAGAPTVTLSGTLTGNCAAGNRAVFLDWT